MYQRLWVRSQKSQHGDQTSQSRLQEIQKAEEAKRAVLMQHAERLCMVAKAQNHAALVRLCGQRSALPVPQQSASPRKHTSSSLRGRKLSPLNMEHLKKNQRTPQSADEETDSFWLLCNRTAGRETIPTALIRSESSLSSVDAHTPTELRDIRLIQSPVEVTPVRPAPPPGAAPPARRRTVSRLPVLSSKLQGKATEKVEAVVEKQELLHLAPVPSPPPPAAGNKTPAVAALAPNPPTGPQPRKRGSRRGASLRPAGVVNRGDKKSVSACSPQTPANEKVLLQPLSNPVESLGKSFKLLSNDNWKKKLEGLKIIQALAQNHADVLESKLHEVCLLLIEEVKNLRSAVACAAMSTIAELYIHLQKAMDPEVEGTGRALLLKMAQTTKAFILQQADIALEKMLQNCSSGRIVSSLINTGLNHRCVAVRRSTALHLHMVADAVGAAHILTAGRSFSERFLTAVAKLALDGAPEVRHHGLQMLHQLAGHREFIKLWSKMVPEKDRCPLDKILHKAQR